MQKIKLTITLATLLNLINYAIAEGGFYIGIGAGYSGLTSTVQSPYQFNDGTNGSQTDGSFASTLYFGYDFNKIVGIQADYNAAWGTSNSNNSYTMNQQLLGGSILVHFPFSVISNSLSGLDVYAKGGLDYNATNFGNVNPGCSNCVNPPNSATGATPLYGAGIEYGFTNVGYRLEWDYSGSLMTTNQGNNQVSITSNSFFLSILYHF